MSSCYLLLSLLDSFHLLFKKFHYFSYFRSCGYCLSWVFSVSIIGLLNTSLDPLGPTVDLDSCSYILKRNVVLTFFFWSLEWYDNFSWNILITLHVFNGIIGYFVLYTISLKVLFFTTCLVNVAVKTNVCSVHSKTVSAWNIDTSKASGFPTGFRPGRYTIQTFKWYFLSLWYFP